MGPTGERYLTPNPGVTAAFPFVTSDDPAPTYPPSRKTAACRFFITNGKRYSILPSRSEVPPVGSDVKSLDGTEVESPPSVRGGPCPPGLHVPFAMFAVVQPASLISFSGSMVRMRGPS